MKFAVKSFCRKASLAQTVVEFALSATVLTLLLFGIAELSLAVYDYNTICSAAREAVRYAIVHSSTSPNPASVSDIQTIAIDHAPALNLTSSDISVSWPADAILPSQVDAQVSISHTYAVQIPLFPAITLTLNSTSRMLVSQ
jgi:Flp pilus assembly protein TadG